MLTKLLLQLTLSYPQTSLEGVFLAESVILLTLKDLTIYLKSRCCLHSKFIQFKNCCDIKVHFAKKVFSGMNKLKVIYKKVLPEFAVLMLNAGWFCVTNQCHLTTRDDI